MSNDSWFERPGGRCAIAAAGCVIARTLEIAPAHRILRGMPTTALRRSHFGKYANDISPYVIFFTRDRSQDLLRCRAN
jgi:hypothetical protein